MIRHIIKKHKHFWRLPDFRQSFIVGALFLAFSLLFNHFSSAYATLRAGNSVTDLLLDNLPVVNVDFVVNEGVILFGAYIIMLLLHEPKKIPFVLKSYALFVLVRAIFVTFTHLGPIPDQSYLDPTELLQRMNIGGDYFFSGHTGAPFLLALIFWNDFRTRIVCFVASFIFATSVIIGHLHYTIDVFAAFFIAHGIYVMAKIFFWKDCVLFNKSDEDTVDGKYY